jgi:hypothetical protein
MAHNNPVNNLVPVNNFVVEAVWELFASRTEHHRVRQSVPTKVPTVRKYTRR